MPAANAFELLKKGPTMTLSGTAMSDAERAETLRKMLEVQVAENLGGRAIAKILGCSDALWSQLRNGKYPGDSDKFLLRGRQWLAARDAAGSTIKPGDYVETEIGQSIQTVCARAWRTATMARIVLPSGAGKTAALMHIKRTFGRRVVYLQAHMSGANKAGIMRSLARASGIKLSEGWPADRIFDQVRQLYTSWRESDSTLPPLILVDEATALPAKCLNYLRQLHDDPEIGAAVVLVDTARLDDQLALGDRKLAGGFEQISSRLAYSYPPAGLDISDLITAQDVQAVAIAAIEANGFEPPARLHKETMRFLHQLATTRGALRNVVNRIRAVADLARDLGCQPAWSVAELDYAAKLTGGISKMPHKVPPFGRNAAADDNEQEQPARRVG